MLTGNWARNFTVANDDVDYLTNLLMERETPMTTGELAMSLIDKRLEDERAALEARYQETQVYNPSQRYEVGQRLIFPNMEYAPARVTNVRAGRNDEHGDFEVIAVAFDDAMHNTGHKPREFAAALTTEHPLSQNEALHPANEVANLTPEQILRANPKAILAKIHNALRHNEVLERVAGYWFPKDLMLELGIGEMHLAEAVLDMAGGGPLPTEDIIQQIGGVGGGEASMSLQIFSMNVAMSQDKRFDEVGPAGEVLWYLKRMEPEAVQEQPELLRYTPIRYNEDLLKDEAFDLEDEIDDELTGMELDEPVDASTITLIYPHRRLGTLPINAETSHIFPRARTSRIYVDFVDTSDGERFPAWIVHEHNYVYGLEPYYSKHRLPIGAYITISKSDEPGKLLIKYDEYRSRIEYIRVILANQDNLTFENRRRSISAEYDDLIIIGVDDLVALDESVKILRGRTLAALIKMLLRELSRLTPQGTVHTKTLYSAINIIRRTPPGPIMATLAANPDFEDLGDNYWKLSE